MVNHKEFCVTMTFTDSIKTVFTKYAEFKGTASRSEYWWWVLFTVLVSMLLGALGTAMLGTDNGSNLARLWSLATLLPSLAVGVRRLRDAGHHWANLFWAFLPIIGTIILIVYLAQPSKPAASAAPAKA